jgi:hypothetical protein
MAKITKGFCVWAVLALVFFLCSCKSPIAENTESNTLLLLITLSSQDLEGNPSNFLQSDVIVTDAETGASTIYADTAKATLKAELMDPSPGVLTSLYNDIELTKYTVTYFRSDGKNTEGVDIPYSFDASLAGYIQVGTSIEVSFVVVREVAKMEPPLLALRESRSEGVLQVTARIDFYGHDLSGKNVKTTGYLTIFFANYAGGNGGEEDDTTAGGIK